MELWKLERKGANPSYLPTVPVEGWSSLVWTERYSTPGDFVLTTDVTQKTLDLLPEKALVAHRDTEVVMWVETRKVKLNEKGWPYLEVRGRSLDCFPENRHVESKYQKKRRMRKQYSPAEAISVLLWNALVNGTGQDVTRGIAGEDDNNDYPMNPKDKVPNLKIANSVPFEADSRKHWRLSEGPLYPQLAEIMKKDDLGLRVVRPPSRKKLITVTVDLEDRGDISEPEMTSHISDLVFEVYKGVDRSQNSDIANDKKIILRWDQEHITDPEYLWSIVGHKTAMEIMSSIGGADAYAEGEATNDGLDRLVGSFDAGSPEYPDEPNNPGKTASAEEKDEYETKMDTWRARKAAINDQFAEDAQKDADRELRKTRRTSVFTGVAAEDIPYKYKKDYDLGDRITLIGEYGMKEDMIVAEYVRTDDDVEGDRGFPTFVLP